MNSILDLHFPEEDQPVDVLLGMPDDEQGNAKEFFSDLDEADREIVQHYVQNFIPPVSLMGGRDTETYVSELVAGYAVVDPARKSFEGVVSALAEIRRVRRYLEIFTCSKGYFPWIVSQSVCFTDDYTGELLVVSQLSWEDIAKSTGIWSTDYFRTEAADRVMPIIDEASSFIENPASSTAFDQDYILYKYQQKINGSGFTD